MSSMLPTIKKSKISHALEEYYASLDFKQLSPKAQYDYRYCLSTLTNTQVGRSKIGVMFFRTLTNPMAQKAYDLWAQRGTPFANHTQAVASKFFNYAIRHGYTSVNPFSNISKRPHKPRKMVWTRTDIHRFLETAYGRFKWRSVGLIVQMAYEWCQRLGDMRNLKWENVDLDAGVLYLEQSKRRAKVEIPISPELLEMLKQQHKELGNQPYVAPYCGRKHVLIRPYLLTELTYVGREIMREAGLPDELQMMDMRRTGTTEMVEAGVPLTNVMMVTGHASPASLKPYIKNTLAGARVALDARRNLLTGS